MNTVPRFNVMPPLSPAVYLRPSTTPPFPLGEPSCRIFPRARHALHQAVVSLGLCPGDEILVPAYHHGSEIEALYRAGLTCRFYGLLDGLEPDEAALEHLRGPATRALLLIHYAGFPQQLAYWRRWCDERSLLLIEDAAQAWLAFSGESPVGSRGDAAIFCLYKTYGLPDGGALIGASGVSAPSGRGTSWWRALARRHLEWLALQTGRPRSGTDVFRPPDYAPDEDFDLGDPTKAASPVTRFLVSRLPLGAAQLRREHFVQFDRVLHDFVPKPFSNLPLGASPFFFPVATDDRERVLSALHRAGVGAHAVWSASHPLVTEDVREISLLRRRLVALPVHQELSPGDVDQIAAAAYRALTAAAR